VTSGHCVFVTGASGYMARALIPVLLGRGHRVRALARRSSAQRVPEGAEVVIGDALDAGSYAQAIAPSDTLVHLVGTPHPSPAKFESFRTVDLPSVDAALAASRSAGVRHFVYVSVAQPAPVMHAYIAVRQAAEARIRASGLAATLLRPWYVLGPGHRWPYVLIPFYALAELLPWTREPAQRLGLVTLGQMIAALVAGIEREGQGVRVLNVADIRAADPRGRVRQGGA
jgi:uncharacterized protein YbjT (DUF2867 family)